MMGSEVFPMIKALGIGARGMDTPAERDFMRKVLTGEISLNKGTLVEMARMRKRVAERAIDRWNKRVDKGELDKFFEASGVAKERIGLPTAERRDIIPDQLAQPGTLPRTGQPAGEIKFLGFE
jgi:hypothetical protein